MYGKKLRLKRIGNNLSENFLFFTIDHGITYGVLPGLDNVGDLITKVGSGGADAVILHKGNAKNVLFTNTYELKPFQQGLGLIIHLNGSPNFSPNPNLKIPVCSVSEALQYGADAVSMHVNIGDDGDGEMLELLGEVSEDCMNWGVPLLTMIYPRGPNVKSEYDPGLISHCVRIGVELGADIIKTNYTGDIDSFKTICEITPIPIVVAGGPKQKDSIDFYRMISDAMAAGARGAAVGRNIFGSTNPKRSTQIISSIVHKGLSVEEVLKKFHPPAIKMK
ncbi:MAG: fructose-bisphosphate aldolase [Candidatus Lokiarchaeota archaeon]|nr:fructose-bisphosphate aldolase [Candidatus Lokiarchaeota archaeon]